MTKFNHCPNCHAKPSGGFFGGSYFNIYECRDCGICYCYKCGDQRCPNCAPKRREEVGTVYLKD
jgi:hypothetical protein